MASSQHTNICCAELGTRCSRRTFLTCEQPHGDEHDEDDERRYEHLARGALRAALPQHLPVHLRAAPAWQGTDRLAALKKTVLGLTKSLTGLPSCTETHSASPS